MSRTRSKAVGFVVAAALLSGACSGSGGSSGSATTTTVKYEADMGVDSPVAALRANLTALLEEHVLLVAITTDAKLGGADPGPPSAVLDRNSAALGAAVTGFYGEPTSSRFLDAWRRHAAGLVAFADVAASTDKAAVAKAKAGLTAIEAEITQILNTANPQLTPDALAKSQASYATKVEAAITAQAKKDAAAATKVKAAADEMASTGIVLAAGIVKQKKDLSGKIDAISAVMRTSLTAKLEEHTYLAGIVTAATVGGGDTKAAGEALDENSVELSRAIGSVYGDDAASRFLQLWRRHITLFVDYTRAAAAHDTARRDAARSALDGYRATFATFLNDANPNLSRTVLAKDLGDHIASLLVAIDAQVAKDPGQVAKLQDAAMHMPETGLLIATGIAQQFPAKFG